MIPPPPPPQKPPKTQKKSLLRHYCPLACTGRATFPSRVAYGRRLHLGINKFINKHDKVNR